MKSLSVADGLFGGELVLIEQSAAAPCRLAVNAARIKARVTPHLGCEMCIRDSGKPITAYDRMCRGAEAYLALADEILKKNDRKGRS